MPAINTHVTFDVTPLPPGVSSEDTLKDLKNQVHLIGKMKPRLSELTKLYQARKSSIDQFVEWYASKPWWGKLLEGGLVVSVSYTVGAFIGAAWVCAALITSLYACAAYIMEEHAELIRVRNTSFADDIKAMEEEIGESIDSFRRLEVQLNQVFHTLNVLHDKRSEDITRSEGEVDTTESKNLRYGAIIEALGVTAKKLDAHQGEVSLTETEVKELSVELKNSLQEAKSLCDMLSQAVSVVEQERAPEPTEEASDLESTASFIEGTDVFISSAQQRLNKLRQASNASKKADIPVSRGVGVVSTALYNFS